MSARGRSEEWECLTRRDDEQEEVEVEEEDRALELLETSLCLSLFLASMGLSCLLE